MKIKHVTSFLLQSAALLLASFSTATAGPLPPPNILWITRSFFRACDC